MSSPINTGTSLPEPPDETQESHKSRVGPIVGGVVGGIAALSLLSATVIFFLRRRRATRRMQSPYDMHESELLRNYSLRRLGSSLPPLPLDMSLSQHILG